MTRAKVAFGAAAIVAVAIAILGVSWWRMQQRFQDFIAKTSQIEKGSTFEQVFQTLGEPSIIKDAPELRSPCLESGSVREVGHVFVGESLINRLLGITPQRWEYVTCINKEHKVVRTFMDITEYHR